jgi:two-component system vancomycin resistance associated response regulator VraR
VKHFQRRHCPQESDRLESFAPQLLWQDGDKVKRNVRVLIADDQPIARRALKVLLATWPELEVVGEAATGQEAIQAAAHLRPDVVLMDVRMPSSASGSSHDEAGLEATRQIKKDWPGIKIIVLTMYGIYQKEALEADADAFLLKGGSADRLIETIHHLQKNTPSQEALSA